MHNSFLRGWLRTGWVCWGVALSAGCATVSDLPPAEVVKPGMDRPVRPVPTRAPATRSVSERQTPPPAEAVFSKDIMAAQTLLDRKNFSCGCADGRMGGQTRAALAAWQGAEGLPATGELDDATQRKLGRPDSAWIVHTVSNADYAAVGPNPAGWVGKSKAEYLGYETLLESLAERAHASEKGLRELNPGVRWPNPPAGTEVLLPQTRPYRWVPATRIVISLGRKSLRVYDQEDRLIAWFPCSIAKDKDKRPRGELTVANAANRPTYLFDSDLFTEDPAAFALNRRLVIPPGPNNPVGVAWIGLSLPGYGIHGTPKPEDIGKTESHGCFRLANWNADKLAKMIAIGVPVVVEE